MKIKICALLLTMFSVMNCQANKPGTVTVNGIPAIWSVSVLQGKNLETLEGKFLGVSGYLSYQAGEDIAYLFNGISELIAFSEGAYIPVEVSDVLKIQFARNSLCHVVVFAKLGRNGLSKKGKLLVQPKSINVVESLMSGNHNSEG